ncbi:hypothetical protein WME99_36575 [Sorangium sp. So ce136]|uniref:hypothetical protein n=1 Tax=Sorangium sp. So ce136 TaxID=3133284 RepID=UPI003F01AFAB
MSIIHEGSFGAFSATVAPHLQRPAFDSLTQLDHVVEATRAIQPVPLQLRTSKERRGLALKALELHGGFEGILGDLFDEKNEIYFVSWAWDLSGEKPYLYPGDGTSPGEFRLKMTAGSARRLLGAGALLFPPRRVTAGLAARIMLWESDSDVKRLGDTINTVSSAIATSKLSNLLQMIALGTGVSGATVALVAQAAAELAAAIGTVLQANSDDFVDFYEGYYPAEQPWRAGEERHEGASSAITLTRIGG